MDFHRFSVDVHGCSLIFVGLSSILVDFRWMFIDVRCFSLDFHRFSFSLDFHRFSRRLVLVSTGLVVQALARPDWLVEIDATAVIPDEE